MEYRRTRLGSSTGTDSLGPFATCAFGGKPSLTGVRSVLWRRDLAGGGCMKKGAYKQLNLTHLEAALREQWNDETCLGRALAAELQGREQKAIARRLKAARIPSKKTVDGFDFTFQPTRVFAQTAGAGGSLLRANLHQRDLSWPSGHREN